MLKLFVRSLALCAIVAGALTAKAAVVTVDPGADWIGYMKVYSLPSAGGGFIFGSAWGTADLVAQFSGSTLTLAPNSIGDPNPFWYTPVGGPGATGSKIFDAAMYVEPPAGTYAGQTLTFNGNVLANTLVGHADANGNGWTAAVFIRDFASDYSSGTQTIIPLVNGVFSISLATVNDPTRHVQYGFETIGPDVWITDAAAYGQIDITGDSGPSAAVPEPSQWAMVGVTLLAGVGVAMHQRRRRTAA